MDYRDSKKWYEKKEHIAYKIDNQRKENAEHVKNVLVTVIALAVTFTMAVFMITRLTS